ncbi:MAG: glycoside hydrolase family 5 protein [Methylacidiphilales bacterium]|nr:glycoside hydrolase family 5 protein [Candidatus Methylacidiphilales bacterium]
MPKNLLLTIVLALCALAEAGDLCPAQTILSRGFDGLKDGPGSLIELPEHGSVLEITNADAKAAPERLLPLPVDRIQGRLILVNCDISADNISVGPEPWNGIKLMARIQFSGGEAWPEADLPVGTFDWRHVFFRFQIPEDATAVTFALGLEKVTGTVRFSGLSVTLGPKFVQASAAPANQPIFVGHDLPRLRGAMVATTMKEKDLDYFTEHWNGNLIRWQLTQRNVSQEDPDFSGYDKWLDEMLAKTDLVIVWAKKRHIKVVLDLHSPPGGLPCSGGYMSAAGPFFTNPQAQAHFIDVWRKMTERYKGNNTIWGFDLVNEPNDDATAPDCMDWQALSLAAGKAVREIDPDRTLIIEPPHGGGPSGFKYFNPVPLERVVYSFHMYEPFRFTYQKVYHHDESAVSYPGEIDGVLWNRAALDKAMKPAINFAERYRVHLYVGEFSTVRWAPGGEKYLSDVISLFEEHGWDWSYHAFREWDGWSLEHNSDINNHEPSTTPTARFEVVEKLWEKNKKDLD